MLIIKLMILGLNTSLCNWILDFLLCQDNNLSLNVIKTKKMTVDYRKRRTAPILIVMAQVKSFKFLGVHITNILSWSKHPKTFVKRAR